METEKWENVGVCGVDAGLILIGDPCYYAAKDCNEHPAETWNEFCDLIRPLKLAQQLYYKNGHPGLGVVIGDFGGDGCYPVFILKNEYGEVISARIDFQERKVNYGPSKT